MKVTFVLPAYYNFPIGGYHVHYTYAGLLQKRGHEVSVIFPRLRQDFDRPATAARGLAWAAKTRLRNRPLIPTFPLEHGVRTKLVPSLAPYWLPDADILVATGWHTAEALKSAPRRKGRKLYIVYDYEFFMTVTPDIRQRMQQTYTSDFAMIATSAAVDEMIQASGGMPAALIPCGVDFASFGMDLRPEARAPLTLGFPLRRETYKGAADAICACSILREIYGESLRVTAFGSHPVDLPPWIRLLRAPSQPELRQFYNEQSVFMLPSHFEGWGLPGVEAMACGAALVATDNGGARDYAIGGKTAMVVPPKQPSLLAEAVRTLFEDDTLRVHLALAGYDQVQQYRWEAAVDALEKIMVAAS